MAIDKSTRQHYEMQGKVKNYLGKQKMVKAPKYWKSGPEHPETELAYITKAEKDLILKKDLHGSLSRGPNIGPSGLMSLNSAGSGYGGPGPGRNGGEGQDRPQGMPAHLSYSPPTTPTYTAPDPVTETVPGDVTFEPEKTTLPTRNIHRDTKETKAEQKITDELNRQNEIRDMIKSQQEEKYGPTADPTKFGETYSKLDTALSKNEEDRTIDDKLAIEEWEKAQDYDKVKDLASRGHDFKEIQAAMDKGLLTKTDPRSMQTQGLLGRGLASLRNIIPKTGLEKSLLSNLTSGGMFDPKKIGLNLARNFAMKKLGLGAAIPWLGLLSFLPQLFGQKGMFAQKPVDMSAFNKLGLYADRFPTATDTMSTLTARGPRTTAEKIATGETDLAELIRGEKKPERTLVADINMPVSGLINYGQFQENITDWPELGLEKQFIDEGLKTKEQQKQFFDVFGPSLKEQSRGLKRNPPKISTEDIQEAMDKGLIMRSAHGGRIDKPLMGRSRDI